MRNIKCKNCGLGFRSDGKKRYCNICLAHRRKKRVLESSRKRMIRNREFLKNYKTGKQCEMCGYDKYPEILVFHHKNKSEKSKGINVLMKTLTNTDTIKQEIEKCMLLCANCHSEIHLQEKYRIMENEK